MGKVLFFIVITFTLSQLQAKQCKHFFAENSTKLTKEESDKIDWFYDSNPSHGYVSEGSHLRWIDINNRLRPDQMIEIPHQEGRFIAFHRLRKGSVGQNFAAVAGVGVVNVKLIDVRTSGQFEKYLQAKLKIIDFFKQNGFIEAPIVYMDHFFSDKLNKWVIVSWYHPGIAVSQLGKFLKGDKLKQAESQYTDFVNQVEKAIQSTEGAPIHPRRLSYYLEKYAVYFDNKWSFNFF